MLRLNQETIPTPRGIKKAKPHVYFASGGQIEISKMAAERIGITSTDKIEFAIMHGKLFITCSKKGFKPQKPYKDGHLRFTRRALKDMIFEQLGITDKKVNFCVLPEPLNYKGFEKALFELKLNEKL